MLALKNERKFPAVFVSAKAERSLRAGHPWLYAEEIGETRGELVPGGITDVFSSKGAWLGAGIYSPISRFLSFIALPPFGKISPSWHIPSPP